MRPVFDLDPMPEPAAAISALAVLRDHTLQAHQAGVVAAGGEEACGQAAAEVGLGLYETNRGGKSIARKAHSDASARSLLSSLGPAELTK